MTSFFPFLKHRKPIVKVVGTRKRKKSELDELADAIREILTSQTQEENQSLQHDPTAHRENPDEECPIPKPDPQSEKP